MLRKLTHRISSEERGFTLIELLVVILIIGILAAIALPAFLGQQSKGQDAAAKSDARNLVSHVESCYATEQDYTHCANANVTNLGNTGLSIGTSSGQVTVTSAASDNYTVTAYSKSSGSHQFVITKNSATNYSDARSCTPSGQGGCPSNGSW